MNDIQRQVLRDLGTKYVWWKDPDDALQFPDRIVAQLMELGDFEDVGLVQHHFGEECFRRVIQAAEPGQFSPRSWAYWHYRLKLIRPEELPPALPTRQVA
jgi:hypothetical protein